MISSPQLNIKYVLLLVLLGLLSIGPVVAQGWDTLRMHADKYEDLSLYYKFSLQPNGSTAEEVAQKINDTSTFKKPPHPELVFHRHEQNGTYWIVIYVQWNERYSEQLMYNFYNDGQRFTLYELGNDTIKTYPTIGAHLGLAQRDLKLRNHSYSLLFQPKETKCLLLKVERTNGFYYFPIDITTTKDYLEFEIPYTLSIGKYLGYFLFAFLFHTVLWFMVRAPTNFWQSAYILAIICFLLYDYGFDVFTIPTSVYPYWASLPKTWFLLVAATCTLQVSFHFLNGKAFFANALTVIRAIHITSSTFIIAIAVAFLLIDINYLKNLLKALDVYIIFVFFCVAFICVIGIIKKQKQAVLYAISFFPVFISVEIFQIHGLSNIRFPIIPPGNVIVGFAWEILFQTILFIVNFKQLVIQKEQLTQKQLEQEKVIQQKYIQAQEEERGRIASDLHDDLGGTISSIKLQLTNWEQNNQPLENSQQHHLLQLVNKANADLRAISHDLTPRNFDLLNLFENLEKRIQEINSEQSTEFTLQLPKQIPSLEKTKAIHIYRIINECIANIIKHAQATQAMIHITAGEKLQISITDNGIGIVEDAEKSGGIGLKNILSRTFLLNGTLEIISKPTEGTTILLEIPLP